MGNSRQQLINEIELLSTQLKDTKFETSEHKKELTKSIENTKIILVAAFAVGFITWEVTKSLRAGVFLKRALELGLWTLVAYFKKEAIALIKR